MVAHVLENSPEVITFEYSNSHKALDVVGKGRSAGNVISVADGTVEMSVNTVLGTDLNSSGTASYGNFVKIRHANGMKTLYAHMKYGSVKVKAGDSVSKGQIIGSMGATGKAYGVHLHFEVRKADETRENPEDYLFGTKEIVPVVKKEEVNITETKTTDNSLEVEKQENNMETNARKEETVSTETTDREDTAKEETTEKKSISQSETLNEKSTNSQDNSNQVKSSVSKNYLANFEYDYYSIVDALKQINVDSSYTNRSKLAIANGIVNYQGTAEQNLQLLSLLQHGKLINV
jgi:hypothetical protein